MVKETNTKEDQGKVGEEWKSGETTREEEWNGEEDRREKEASNSPERDHLARAREDELTKLTPWKQRFILSMRQMPHITAACVAANCSSSTAYEAKERDELFRKLWDESLTYATDRLEGAAWTRAVDGVEKGIYGRDGEVIATEKVYSDKLLETLLKGNLPQKYRENSAPQVTVNVLNWSNGGAELPQPVEDKGPLHELSEDDVELLGDP